jgi:hypothetical protein
MESYIESKYCVKFGLRLERRVTNLEVGGGGIEGMPSPIMWGGGCAAQQSGQLTASEIEG